MIIDVNNTDAIPEVNYDYCIIGAGAAGITLALELENSSTRIALLESGNENLEWQTQQLYETEISEGGLPRRNHFETRLRMLGGTTNHWNGRCGPFSQLDFSTRSWVPHSGWPITKAQLQPYYQRSTDYLDLAYDQFDLHSLRDKGIPLPAPNEEWDFHVWQYSAPTRYRLKYADRLKSSKSIHLYVNTNVTHLNANGNESSLEGVDVASLQGFQGEIKARHYILCCGGIENPRIMLSSNRQFPNGVGNKNDLVGRYFMEHLRTKLQVDLGSNDYALSQTYNTYVWNYRRYMLGLELTEALQTTENILNAGCWMEYAPKAISPTRSLTRIMKGNIDRTNAIQHVKESISGAEHIYRNLRRRLTSPGAPMLDKAVNTVVIETEQAPDPDSRITLSESRDGLGMRKAEINWVVNELDIKTAKVASFKIAKKLTSDHGIRLRMPQWMWQDESMWRANFIDVSHHMGTTRMATHEREGVVDSDCRVFGYSNFHISGSSLFPTSGHVNPTMTIVALAIRLADHLKNSGN